MASPGDPLEILRAVYGEVLPHLDAGRAVRNALRVEGDDLVCGADRIPLPTDGRVTVVAVGKAAVPMAEAAMAVLGAARESGLQGGRTVGGLVVAPASGARPQPRIPGLAHWVAEHPVPGPGSAAAAEAVLRELRGRRGEADVVVFLVSGGGSALLEAPLPPLASSALAEVHDLLVHCGADIVAMNAVRKHLSAVKGGRLAVAAAPARQVTLLVSDVPDGALHMVASGPTVPDPTTAADVRNVLDRFALTGRLPPAVRAMLPGLSETPKEGHPAFASSVVRCVLDNGRARELAAGALGARGIRVCEDMTWDDAPVGDAVDGLVARLDREFEAGGGVPTAVVSGGEVSCPVTGDGVGGRNLHFALLAAHACAGRHGMGILSVGTDGVDGGAPVAGAAVDGTTWGAMGAAGRDPASDLSRCNSFPALHSAGSVVDTGPTGTNVRDLRLLVRMPSVPS